MSHWCGAQSFWQQHKVYLSFDNYSAKLTIDTTVAEKCRKPRKTSENGIDYSNCKWWQNEFEAMRKMLR